MSEEGETARARLDAFLVPYGREIRLDEVDFESGMKLLRVTIREGRRFTVMDIDPAAAEHWGQAMTDWAARTKG